MKAKLLGAVALCLLGVGFTRPANAQGYSYTTIDFPSATFTFAQGINDAGQIVGGYSVGGSGLGFLLQRRPLLLHHRSIGHWYCRQNRDLIVLQPLDLVRVAQYPQRCIERQLATLHPGINLFPEH